MSSVSNSYIDVHIFDRKLEETKIIKVSDSIALKYLIDFKARIKDNSSAMDIFSDIIIKRSECDLVNKLVVFDLLIAILYKIDVSEHNEFDKNKLYKLIEEQLEDTKKLGSCIQGKSIRLYQIYKSLCF